MPITKNVLTSPSRDDVLDHVGGSGGASDQPLELTFAPQDFDSKDAYQGLDLVQPAVIIVSRTRDTIVITFRVDTEVKEGVPVERKMKGHSILFSSSGAVDAAGIVADKVESGVTNVAELPVSLVGANVLDDGTAYFFDVTVVEADLADTLEGRGSDKQVGAVDLTAAAALLKSKMEQRLLALLQGHLTGTP